MEEAYTDGLKGNRGQTERLSDGLTAQEEKNGDYVWVQFSTQFADEYIDGYQVAYSVLTNIDNVVRIRKEQSVTYENLPGFVAKYRVEKQRMILI